MLSDHAKFPSHIGSRSTLRDGYREGNSLSVSIPHWFSLNEKNLAETRRTETVSIPHWFSLNEKRIRRELIRGYCFHPTLVLAQRLFWTKGRNAKALFPSHIGSRSTIDKLKGLFNMYLSFHPTLVLAQRVRTHGRNVPWIQFPSHIGSRSTGASQRLGNAFEECFHPTLALAQPFR